MREREIEGHCSLRQILRLRYYYSFITTLREWHVRRALKQFIDRELLKGGHVLDAGCGDGQHAYWIAKEYPQCQVVALDCDKVAIQRLTVFANEMRLKNLFTEIGYLEELCEADVYDLVLNGSVLYSIPDDHRVMRNIACALREGGMLVLYSHTKPGYLHRRDPEAVRRAQIETSTRHFSRDYSVPELRSLIEKSGLAIDRVDITYGWFGSLGYEIFHAFAGKRGFRYWFPLYLLLIHPLVLLLMLIDFQTKKQRGNGVLIIAHKPMGVRS